MTTPKRKKDSDSSGWYINAKGEVCYDGQCFSITGSPDTGEFEFAFDDQCDHEAASQADRTLMKNMLNGKGVTYRRRRKVRSGG